MPPLLHHQVRELGRAGTPTVLIHGVGSDLRSWSDVVARLKLSGPVVTYDLRGHGRSATTPGPWELDDFVADHLGVLADLGVSHANVVGFSLGGLIAQAIALREPATVDRLVVLSAVAGRTAEERAAVAERLEMVDRAGPRGAAQRSATRWYSESFTAAHPDLVAEHAQRLAANDEASYKAAYRVLATSDLLEKLSKITAPVLAATGEHDIGSPPHMARAIAATVGDGRFEIIPGVRHAILDEAPEAVASLINGFLTEPAIDRAAGMEVRREVLGDMYVNRAMAHDDALSVEFQQFLTEYCWGEIWTDSRLTRRERSLLVLGMTAAQGRMAEFEAHTRGAVRNGLTEPELASVLRQVAVYCGIPAGVNAVAAMRNGIVSAAAAPEEPEMTAGHLGGCTLPADVRNGKPGTSQRYM